MELWIPVVVVLDIVIVVVLVFLIVKLRQLSTETSALELEEELEKLKHLTAHFEAKKQEVIKSLERIKSNQTRLDDIINKLEDAIEQLRRMPPPGENREQLYAQARQMLHRGVPEEEVAKRLGLSRAELTLLVTVEKMRKN